MQCRHVLQRRHDTNGQSIMRALPRGHLHGNGRASAACLHGPPQAVRGRGAHAGGGRGHGHDGPAMQACDSHLDLSRAPYGLYDVKYIDPVSLTLFAGATPSATG